MASKSTENIPEHVGRLMRKWRLAAGRSQQEVADEIGCSKSHISQAETGRGNMSLPVFLAFCQAIETPASKVLEERLLARHRDADRLAADLIEKAGLAELAWLADLPRDEVRLALARAHEAVEFAQARKGRRPERGKPASA